MTEASYRPLTPFVFPRTGQQVRNRMVVAAMTNKQSMPDGTLHQRELDFLEARAKGGFGIVTTCAAFVSPDGRGWEGELGVHDDAMLPGLERLAGALRAHGALSLVQLFHGGVRAPSKLTGQQPWSASEHGEAGKKGFEVPRAATQQDIERTIEAFAAAAERADKAGFDGVELHGAHGYLLSQFLGSVSNTRDDEWGGDIKARMRFVTEIFDAAKARTREGFLVGIRLSPEIRGIGVDLDESLQVAGWLAERGADFIHASLWDYRAPSRKYPQDAASLTARFRQAIALPCPLIVTGGVWSRQEALEVMEQGADLVGMGRAAIGNPAWPQEAVAADFEPAKPPYSAEQLSQRALSDIFIDYMRNWPGFVA